MEVYRGLLGKGSMGTAVIKDGRISSGSSGHFGKWNKKMGNRHGFAEKTYCILAPTCLLSSRFLGPTAAGHFRVGILLETQVENVQNSFHHTEQYLFLSFLSLLRTIWFLEPAKFWTWVLCFFPSFIPHIQSVVSTSVWPSPTSVLSIPFPTPTPWFRPPTWSSIVQL